MKVLFIAPQPFYTVRGTPIAVRQLVEAMTARGWDVDLLTYHVGADPGIPRLRILRIPSPPGVRNIPPGFSLRKLFCDALLFWKALRVARAGGYDYVHAVEEGVFMAMALRRLRGLPYVYDMDSSMADQLVENGRGWRGVYAFLRRCEAAAIRGACHVLAVCDALAQRAQDHGARRVTVLRDAPAFEGHPHGDAAGPRPAAAGGRETRFAYVGNLEPYQGIDLLLRGFAHVVRGACLAALIVVGGTEEEIERYRQVSRRLRIEQRVQFVGPCPPDRVEAIVADVDVLVSPRIRGVNTPMKIYAYLNAGKAILATDIDSHTQVLTPEVAVLAPASEECFGSAMCRLAADASLRQDLACHAAQLAAEKYSRGAFDRTAAAFCAAMEAHLAPVAPAAG